MKYQRVVASSVGSQPSGCVSCQRCGRELRGKGGERGDADGHVLCRDCGSDTGWAALAAGRVRWGSP